MGREFIFSLFRQLDNLLLQGIRAGQNLVDVTASDLPILIEVEHRFIIFQLAQYLEREYGSRAFPACGAVVGKIS
jgi:hypothetical protein